MHFYSTNKERVLLDAILFGFVVCGRAFWIQNLWCRVTRFKYCSAHNNIL